jgi:hypothetical protein
MFTLVPSKTPSKLRLVGIEPNPGPVMTLTIDEVEDEELPN